MPHRKRIYWVVFIAIEILIFCAYRWCQRHCEPRLPNWPCPPCISDQQIVLRYSGIGMAAVFFGWLAIHFFKPNVP